MCVTAVPVGCHMVVHQCPSKMQTVHSKRAFSAADTELEVSMFGGSLVLLHMLLD